MDIAIAASRSIKKQRKVHGCFFLKHSLSNTSALPAVRVSASSPKPSMTLSISSECSLSSMSSLRSRTVRLTAKTDLLLSVSRIEADLSRIVAQEPGADPMEGPGPKRVGHDTGVIADHPARDSLDAPRHLGGGAAREGHQQDFAGIGTIDDQVGHPVRQGVGLAGHRPGTDEV